MGKEKQVAVFSVTQAKSSTEIHIYGIETPEVCSEEYPTECFTASIETNIAVRSATRPYAEGNIP